MYNVNIIYTILCFQCSHFGDHRQNIDICCFTIALSFMDHNVNSIVMFLVTEDEKICLSKMKVNLTPEPDSSQGFNWTLVDEDGEEDDDPVNSWMFLMENDLVSLLSQFHFGAMFNKSYL
ncbi:uncharacterized protein LOC144352214 [Saccoglossus kowalevskii]